MSAAGVDGSISLKVRTPRGPVPLGFVREDAVVFLVATARGAQWPVDLLRRGVAELSFSQGPARGTAQLVSDPVERERILTLFREKYGAELYERWYARASRVIRVGLESDPVPIEQGSARYYEWLRTEFDTVADEYDRHILGNRMNRLLRDRSLATLRPRFAGRRRLLEIGCGSGMETLPLLRAGHEIVALDISERMLAVTRSKAEAEGLAGLLTTRSLAARDLPALASELGPDRFDGAYSTYGALNCEPDLAAIPAALHGLLAPGAPFVAGVYNRWCLFETAGYSATGQWRRAWGRRRNPVPVGASRFCVDVYAHSVAEFRRLFGARFAVERVEAVPALLPPSDLTVYAEKFARHFDTLARWDARVGRRWPFNRLGDHFLMTFVRREVAG